MPTSGADQCCSHPVPPDPTPKAFSVLSCLRALGGMRKPHLRKAPPGLLLRVAGPQGAAGEAHYPQSCLGAASGPVQALCPQLTQAVLELPRKTLNLETFYAVSKRSNAFHCLSPRLGARVEKGTQPLARTEYRKPVPPSLLPPSLLHASLLSSPSFSPPVLCFTFSLLLLRSLLPRGPPNCQGKTRDLSSTLRGSWLRASPSSQEQTQADRAPLLLHQEARHLTLIHSFPLPLFHQGTPTPRTGSAHFVLTLEGAERSQSAVAAGQWAPLGGGQAALDAAGTSWVLSGAQLCVRHASRMHVLLDKVSNEAEVTPVFPCISSHLQSRACSQLGLSAETWRLVLEVGVPGSRWEGH